MEINTYTTLLTSYSTFLCSIILFLRWRVKKLGPVGNGGTVLISSWKCNDQYLLWYPSILGRDMVCSLSYFICARLSFRCSLLCLHCWNLQSEVRLLLGNPSNIHTYMPSIGSLCLIINFSITHVCINHSPEKWRFWSLQSLLLPQFFLLPEETCAHAAISRQTSKLVPFFYPFLKLLILQKNVTFKIFPKIYYWLWSEKSISQYTYIFTKCNDDFQFSILSKILWGVGFSLSGLKRQFIFYSSFSLHSTENLHEQKYFLKRCSSCSV